jgi:LysM repeat protein
MRYKILLNTLKVLIYVKRFFWWLTAKIGLFLAKIFAPGWKILGFFYYKISYFNKKIANISGIDGQMVKRDNLQTVIFLVLFFLTLPQTRLYAKKEIGLPGSKTLAYALTPVDQDYSIEEVNAEQSGEAEIVTPSTWKTGVVSQDQFQGVGFEGMELSSVVAGGNALAKPTIFPGAAMGGGRDKIIEYIVQEGDSLGRIASKFQISIATILWENNLGVTSYLHPGDKLTILPVSGLTHMVRRGDTLKKIATLYSANVDEIIKFNKLKEDGTDLIIGEKIMVPNGLKTPPKTTASLPRPISSVVAPPSSRQIPTVSGFVWPTAVRLVTQYFTWQHHGLDIAGGSLSTPNYAAKAGVVEKSQCGWNSGYGCVIIIDHGGGIKTLYGHNSRLLVSVGDRVEAGQTIGLMGNTGNVRGRTGIHLHFEVWVNGVRTNPFKFVK